MLRYHDWQWLTENMNVVICWFIIRTFNTGFFGPVPPGQWTLFSSSGKLRTFTEGLFTYYPRVTVIGSISLQAQAPFFQKSPSFPSLCFLFLPVSPLSAAQWKALKSQKNFFFFPPVTSTKPGVFKENLWIERRSHVCNPSFAYRCSHSAPSCTH